MSGNYYRTDEATIQNTARLLLDAVRLEIQASAGPNNLNGGVEACTRSSADERSITAKRAIAIVAEHRMQVTGSFTVPNFAVGYLACLDAVEGLLKAKLK